MLRRLTCILWVGLLTACSPPHPGKYASQPPAAYQKDVTAIVRFEAPDKAAMDCHDAVHEPGVTPEWCVINGVAVWPNPCAWPNDSDYRQGGCHEVAHVNKWPANHPGAIW